jgi:hypothetical protein
VSAWPTSACRRRGVGVRRVMRLLSADDLAGGRRAAKDLSTVHLPTEPVGGPLAPSSGPGSSPALPAVAFRPGEVVGQPIESHRRDRQRRGQGRRDLLNLRAAFRLGQGHHAGNRKPGCLHRDGRRFGQPGRGGAASGGLLCPVIGRGLGFGGRRALGDGGGPGRAEGRDESGDRQGGQDGQDERRRHEQQDRSAPAGRVDCRPARVMSRILVPHRFPQGSRRPPSHFLYRRRGRSAFSEPSTASCYGSL